MRLVKYRGKYAVRFADGRRASTGIDYRPENRGLAERQAHEIVRHLTAPLETVADVWSAYMDDHGATRIAADRLRYAWAALEPHFGHLAPHQVTRASCRAYTAARGRAPGTVRRELASLNAALRWHDKNTPAIVEMPPAPRPRDRYLTRAEFDRLVAAAVSDHVRLFIRLALVTAARKSALLTLTWRAIDLDRRRINLGHVQGGKGRSVVPITDATLAWLQDARERATTDWVIEWDGARVKKIDNAFARTARRAGMPDVTPHVIRHTAAVWLVEGGASMSETAQFLGHTDERITARIYARYSPDHLRSAASILDV